MLIFFLGFAKMSNIESINLSIKIGEKAIDVIYEGWTKIYQLIQESNDNRKKLHDVTRTFLGVVIAMHFFQQNSIDQLSLSYATL